MHFYTFHDKLIITLFDVLRKEIKSMASNTKVTIFQAYAHMITIKNIDKVTVKDVVERCGITRQTFYYHFQDLLDVIEWGLRRGAESALQKGLTAGSVEEALRTFLTLAEQNRAFGRKILNSQKKNQICDMMLSAVHKWLFVMFKEKNTNDSMTVEELDFALHFYAYAISGTTYDVIMNENADVNISIHRIITLMGPVISGMKPAVHE